MAGSRTRFTPEYRLRAINALAASNNDLVATAQAFGVRPRTLADWRRQRQQIVAQAEFDQRAADQQQSLSVHYDLLTRQVIDLLPDKIKEAKLSDALRAITMLKELKQGVNTRRERSTAVRDKLTNLVERYTAQAQASAATPEADPDDDDPDDNDDPDLDS